MTEKRFIGSSGGVYDKYKGDRFTWAEWEEIIQIMNNLNEKARERSKALSKLQKENEQLEKLLKCRREEANDYCEELMGKDEFIRLYKRIGDELKEENEQLKKIRDVAFELAEKPTQHTLWKLRSFLKEYNNGR